MIGTGCTEEEYDNFIAGSVALLSYTTSENCSLYDKVGRVPCDEFTSQYQLVIFFYYNAS